jgi:hypothetical protein
MFNSTFQKHFDEGGAADVLVPLIRAAATIGFVIAPCSLGFVIIAVSEQLIRSIMVGDDPELLVSDLQNRFPSSEIEVLEDYDPDLVAHVIGMIERRDEQEEASGNEPLAPLVRIAPSPGVSPGGAD